MSERSVTRAAERLGRTQSAVSHSLARLRHGLGDPLLLKGNRRMEPTPFALALLEQARPILRSLQRMLSPLRQFDPALSHRVFRLAAPDFVLTLFTELLSRLRADAPGVAIEWTAPRETMLLEVAEGQLDAAIAPAGLRLPAGIGAEPHRRAALALLRPQGSPGLRALERSGLGAVASCRRPRRRSPREPGQCRRGAGRAQPDASRAGCRISRSSRRCWQASDLLATLPSAGNGRHAGPVRPRELAPRALRHRAPAACPAVVGRAGQRSRSRLAAQEPAATGEKTLCKCG